MIVDRIGQGTAEDPFRADESQIPEEAKEHVEGYKQISETEWEVKFSPKYEVNRLRSEFNKKLNDRVNQIAEAVASGARGQQLADKMRE